MLRSLSVIALLACAACSDAMAGCTDDTTQVAAPAAAAPQNAAPVIAAVAEPAAAVTASAAGAGVTGKITFEGTPPARDKVDLNPDPVCKKHHGETGLQNPIGVEVDGSGGLANVFVQITGVPESANKDGKDMAPVVLDQVGCTYVPHVFGAVKKQKITIKNSDPTLHNIHGQPKVNKEFNYAMPDMENPREVEFKKIEDAIHVKCDVHPWMGCFVFVLDHTYFGVSGKDGSFRIDTTGLPDGEYGIKAWQEVLGTAEGKVTVKDGAATFSHVFKK
jgi:hypothetical protein